MPRLASIVLLLSYLSLIKAVRIFPSTHKANTFDAPSLKNATRALSHIREGVKEDDIDILQSSFEHETFPLPMRASTNGLVYSLLDAYNHHRHLIIRPDDIWFAVLSQLSIYINAHAEELRDKFVTHQGQKVLKIQYGGDDRRKINYAHFAQSMTELLQSNIVDEFFLEWILPDFTTTTETDTTVASILMMCSMQKYFKFQVQLCGIPSVTLLGEKKDYEDILSRLDKLADFGEEPTRFMDLLKPVVRRLIMSFDEPESQQVIDFWQRVMDVNNQLSGFTDYTGWITAFWAWDEKGTFLAGRVRSETDPDILENDGRDLSYSENGDWGEKSEPTEYGTLYYWQVNLRLELDGVKYPVVESKSIPPGWGKVPVEIVGDPQKPLVEAEMVAGSIGQWVTSSGEKDAEGVVGMDTIQPHVGWWIWESTAVEVEPPWDYIVTEVPLQPDPEARETATHPIDEL